MALESGASIDRDGNAISSQTNGSQQALDVGINVSGIQVDPRVIRNLTPATDKIDVGAITGPVVLPTGASTDAKQDVGNTSLASIDGKLNSLGQKASAASVPVVIANDQSVVPVTMQPIRGTLTDGSGVISTTSVQVFAANANRNYLFIQNISGNKIWLNFGIAAINNQPSILLAPGASMTFDGFICTQSVNIIGQANNLSYVAKQG